MQQLPSWMIKSLPVVHSSFQSPKAVIQTMKSLGTTATRRQDIPGLWEGQTTWGWEEDGKLCAIGWDWIEMMPGVPVLADPMNLMSNAVFSSTTVDDQSLFGASMTLALNSIVYLLPWQMDVLASCRGKPRAQQGRQRAQIVRAVLPLAA